MSITHIVLFQFKANVAPEAIKEVCDKFLELGRICLRPSSSEPYLRTAIGGKDNSPEGLQRGITHAFVVEFKNADDRNYYLKDDPAHRAFTGGLQGLTEKVQVVDFTNGSF